MMSQMWNPYQSKTISTPSLPTAYSTSSSPVDISSSSGSSSTNSSTSEKMMNNGNLVHQTPLSISSLLQTPGYDEDDEQNQAQVQELSSPDRQDEQILSSQNNSHQQQQQQIHQQLSQQNHHTRSSIGGSTGNSTDSSSIVSSDSNSATSSPTFRSPQSSFTTSYSAHSNYNFAPHNHHFNPQLQQNSNYQYFSGIELNNHYYNAVNSESLKIKNENFVGLDYSTNSNSNRYSSGSSNGFNKDEVEVDVKPFQQPPIATTPPSSSVLPISNMIMNHSVNAIHQYPHYPHNSNHYSQAAVAYYNNMSLSQPTIPTTYPHYNPHYLNPHHPFAHQNQHPYPHHHNSYAHQHLASQESNNNQSGLPNAQSAAAPIKNNQANKNEHINTNVPTVPPKVSSVAVNNNFSPFPTTNNNNNNSNDSYLTSIPVPNNPKPNSNIKAKLQDMSLWKQFNQIGTEMIITKCGRRMFPSLRVSINGLEATKKYTMIIDIIPVDDNRYKYHNCEWVVSGKAEAHFAGRSYLHPDSPLNGSQWMKQVISFHKLKLTNNPFDRAGHIILNSMHKYAPRLTVVEEGYKSVTSFIFEEAMFTAVTAYQNEAITKLKIEYNPFAKGFRDGQSRKDYRGKRSSDDENESIEERNTFNQMMSNNQNKCSKTTNPNPLGNKDLNKLNQQHQQQNLNQISLQQQQQQQQQQRMIQHQQLQSNYSNNLNTNKFNSNIKFDNTNGQQPGLNNDPILFNY